MIVAEQSIQGTPLFRLLETLRQYGQERLAARGEAVTEALRARHTTYFIALAEQVSSAMHGPDQPKWSERLELEHDNLRAGLEWGKAAEAPPNRVDLALRLAAPLYLPWLRQGHGREGRQHFETLLAHRHAQRPTRARAQVLFAVGSLALWQDGEDANAWALLNECLSLAEQLGDTHVMAEARHNLGVVLGNRGDKPGARQQHEEALRLTRADGDLSGIRWSLEDLADVAADEGDTEHAWKLCEEALSLARQTGDQHGIASILRSMGAWAHAAGKSERARDMIGESLSIMQRIGCRHCSALHLGELALVASACAETGRAVRLLGAADALRERTGIVIPMPSVAAIEKTLSEARCQLGEAVFADAWSEGRAMSLPQVSAYAWEPSAANRSPF
jgi:non-specific serine/threonine protein kinase